MGCLLRYGSKEVGVKEGEVCERRGVEVGVADGESEYEGGKIWLL